MRPTTKKRPGTRLGVPDRFPRRLKAGEVRCAECLEPMFEVAAVLFQKQHLHPIGCFGKLLARTLSSIEAAIGGAR